MAKYIVSYNVTVDVVVDLGEGTIEKVVINDDCMGDPYAYFNADDDNTIRDEIWMTDNGRPSDPTDNALIEVLYATVEGPHAPEWPSWDHGW